jgi:hypothetical protein
MRHHNAGFEHARFGARAAGYDVGDLGLHGSAVHAVGCSRRRMICRSSSSAVIDDLGEARILVGRHALAGERSNLVGRHVLPRLQADDGLDRLAAIRVGNPNDGRFADGRVLIEHFFNLARPDLEPRSDEHVLLAVDEIEPAVLVQEDDVAGPEACGRQRCVSWLARSPARSAAPR